MNIIFPASGIYDEYCSPSPKLWDHIIWPFIDFTIECAIILDVELGTERDRQPIEIAVQQSWPVYGELRAKAGSG